MVRTLIFDCDGVLADTERHGHLVAFNQTFAELGLPVRWTEEEYAKKLEIGGGKERMATLFTPELIDVAGLPRDTAGQRRELDAWHRRKTKIYTDLVAAKRLPPRPGISRIVEDALSEGWQLAVASTSAEESVRAILENAVGGSSASRFSAILAGDVVPRKKPAPDIYRLATDVLDADPELSLVIEDSRNGLLAADAAGLPCFITVSDYTQEEDFDTAQVVVTSLGEPEGPRTRVIRNRGRANIREFVTLADLAASMAR